MFRYLLVVFAVLRLSTEEFFHFYTSIPRFEPAKLEVSGFLQIPDEHPLVVDHGEEKIKLSLDDSVLSSQPRDAEQRFLGFGGLAYSPRKTRTVVKTLLESYNTLVSTCLICLSNQIPVSCIAASPSPRSRPNVCARRRKDVENTDDVEPSRVVQVVTTVISADQGRDPVILDSSIDDSVAYNNAGRSFFSAKDADSFEYVVETTLSLTLTTTNTKETATIQVGTMACLSRFLTGYPDCKL